MIATLADGRTWFKARVGFDLEGLPEECSLCAHTLQQPGLLIVPDASLDARFKRDPLVTSYPRLRFYAGFPLRTADGVVVGSLSVVDTIPRELTPDQKDGLVRIARQVQAQFELTDKMNRLVGALAEKARTERDLHSSSALFRVFMDNSPLVSFMKDTEGRMIYYNRRFAERFAITEQEWLGKSDFELWPTDFAAAFRATDLAVFAGGELVVTEELSPGPGDEAVHWRTYKFPFTDAFGEQFLAGMSLDITFERQAALDMERSHSELQAVAQQLAELSLRDALTGLRNRRAFDERLQQEFALARRHAFPLSVLLFDVDDFKSINDTLGHEQGDNVLRQVAQVMQRVARNTDLVCRYGGEEFALVLPNTPLESAVRLGNRIRLAIEHADWQTHHLTDLTVSAGAASNSPEVSDLTMLLRQADTALYEAKAAGKNRVLVHHAPE